MSWDYRALTVYSYQVSLGYIESVLHIQNVIIPAINRGEIKEVSDRSSFHSLRICSLDSLHNSFEQLLRSMVYLEGEIKNSKDFGKDHNLVKILNLMNDQDKYNSEVESLLEIYYRNAAGSGRLPTKSSFESIFRSNMKLDRIVYHVQDIYRRNGGKNMRYSYEKDARGGGKFCIIETREVWRTLVILLAFAYAHKDRILSQYKDFNSNFNHLIYLSSEFSLFDKYLKFKLG